MSDEFGWEPGCVAGVEEDGEDGCCDEGCVEGCWVVLEGYW